MRMGRSVNVCPECVDTPIGRYELESDVERERRLFGARYGDARTRFSRAMKTWAPHLTAEKKS